MLTPAPTRNANPQRTRAIMAATKLTLTQRERRELAALLVDHHGSWSTLSEDDARRIADSLDAFHAIQALFLMRRGGPR